MVGQHYYTWCAPGAGLGETSGFQTRARSSSISPEIERTILRFCTKYELPRSLSSLTSKVSDLTAEELAGVPVALHYFAIGSELRALTRIRLRSEQSGRGGNFLAHTLVFPVDALKKAAFNPFPVIRSGIFVNSDADKPKQLEELTELPLATAGHGDRGDPALLNVDAIEKLFRSLVVKPEDRRPVILVPSRRSNGQTLTPRERTEETAALIEAALLLLPDDARAHLAFSTYELDPYRLLDSGGLPLQVVATFQRDEGGSFEFREDQYQTSFFVVNLPDNRSSEVTLACRKYAELAGAALRGPGVLAASDFEERRHFLGALHAGLAPQTWDDLAQAKMLSSSLPELQEADWKAAARVLATNCTEPASAKPALELLSTKAPPKAARASLLLLGGGKQGAPGLRWYLSTVALVVLSVIGTGLLARHLFVVSVAPEARQHTAGKSAPILPVAAAPDAAAQELARALVGPGVQVNESAGLVKVVFDTRLFGDNDSLLPDARPRLADLVKRIPRNRVAAINVIGTTDSRPMKNHTGFDNYDLGYRRAVAAVHEMRDAGLPLGLFRVFSTGPDKPEYSDPADPRNRTVVLRLEPKP